jgi:RNA polymerase sigma-70 factor, ECF subfamily
MFSMKEHCDRVLELWQPLKEKAYWVVVSIVGDMELAKDVLQESLIIAIEKFQTLRDESKFEPWFITISIRKSYEVLASKKIFANAQSLDDGYAYEDDNFAPDDAFSSTQYKEMVVLILKTLKPETKKYLFYLKYIEDKPLDEIVRITGIKEGTLKSIYSRMRKELSSLLGREYGING